MMGTPIENIDALLDWILEQKRRLSLSEIREYKRTAGLRFGSGADLIDVLLGFRNLGKLNIDPITFEVYPRDAQKEARIEQEQYQKNLQWIQSKIAEGGLTLDEYNLAKGLEIDWMLTIEDYVRVLEVTGDLTWIGNLLVPDMD